MSRIASVSLDQPLAELANELGRSFADHGFAIVREHRIAPDLIERSWQRCRALFALPEETKLGYHQPGLGGARGYTPFGTERAKGAEVRDLKEFWHVGRDLPAGDPLARYMAPNVWPQEIAAFRETFEALFAAFEATGRRILSAVALHLGLDQRFFDATVENGNSVLRLLHYPPMPAAADGAIRAAPHEDINTITLLLGAEEAGLELRTRDGRWVPVAPPPGALAVNVGDMLQRMTAGAMRSTTHRVINPSGDAARRSRYAMPFFLHFRPDFVIEPLPHCLAGRAASAEPAITAHEYLQLRLREIKLA
ncbi:MAG: 2-oxoglutarate and iron-dependent oxygenase domain-containing protein [Novosphingobium sp.]